MLKYQCILCGIEWGSPEAGDADISHGCCPLCLRQLYTERIRSGQLRSGYSDCFNRGFNDCNEIECWFRQACQDHFVEDWKKSIIEAHQRRRIAC
jgi:hypothetical protein